MAADTWREALRDPHVTIHWLLAISQSPNTGRLSGPYRYADANLHIGAHKWVGALEVTAPPGLEVDPYTGRSSSPNLVATLYPVADDNAEDNPSYPYDLEAAYNKNFLSLMAKCYRWAEGTPFSEAQLLVDGYIYGVSLEENGLLKLDIADKILRFNRKLPRYHISDVRWANPYGDDKAAGYPILYGAYVRVPCPVHDTVNNRALVADGTINAPTAVYVDDITSTFTTGTETDLKGITVTYVDANTSIVDNQVTVSGDGYDDDADGYYTGTANALIEHPADQLHHLMRTFAGIPAEFIDDGSLRALRAELPGWVGSVQVMTDEEKDFFTVRNDMMTIMRSAAYAELGVFRARHLSFSRGHVMHLRYGENLMSAQTPSWGEKNELYTSLQIRYAWRWIQKKKQLGYSAAFTLDENDYDGFKKNRDIIRGVSNADIGRRMVVETRAIQSDGLAEKVAWKLAELYGMPRKTITAICDRTTHDLRMFDTVRVTMPTAPSDNGLGYVGKRFIVVGFRYGLNSNTLTLMEV